MQLGACALRLKDEVLSVREAQTGSDSWWWRSKPLTCLSNSDIYPKSKGLRVVFGAPICFLVCDSRRALLFLFNSTSLWFFSFCLQRSMTSQTLATLVAENLFWGKGYYALHLIYIEDEMHIKAWNYRFRHSCYHIAAAGYKMTTVVYCTYKMP